MEPTEQKNVSQGTQGSQTQGQTMTNPTQTTASQSSSVTTELSPAMQSKLDGAFGKATARFAEMEAERARIISTYSTSDDD